MEEQEIMIKDLFKILSKRRKLIASITLISAIVAMIYAFIQTPVYKSYSIIEPPRVNDKAIGSAESMEVLFKNPLNPYLIEISSYMGLTPKDAYSIRDNFTVKDKSGFVVVSALSENPEKSVQLSNIVVKLLLERYNIMVDGLLKNIDSDIAALKIQLDDIKKEMNIIDKKIETSEKADSLAKSQLVSAYLIYKDNIAKRQSDLYDKLFQKESARKYSFRNAAVIAEPSVPVMPENKSKKNIILLGAAAGLVLASLLAFILEMFENT